MSHIHTVRSGIQRVVLARIGRWLTSLALVLFVVFGSSRAFADNQAPREGASILPGDVPIVVSATHTDIPRVPTSYVTRDLGWITIAHPPGAEERAESIVRDANEIKRDLLAVFGVPVLEHVEVRIAPTVEDMASLAPQGSPPPTYASGVAYPRLKLVLLSMLAPRHGDAVDLDVVFRHELVHVALEDATFGKHVPLWFNEGIAIYFSKENPYDRSGVLWRATTSGTLLPLSEIDRAFPTDHHEVNVAYAESADFLRFLLRDADRARFHSMIKRVRDGHAFDVAIADAYGSDLRRLEFQWRSDVEKRYSVIPLLTGGGIVWVLVIGALGYAYVKRRRRSKAILAMWEREEALEDARRAREVTARESDFRIVSHSVPPSAKVEHRGHWHTLH